jgi:NAD kinase
VVDTASRDYTLAVPSPNKGSSCVVDGRLLLALQAGDKICVSLAAPKFCLIETNQHSYYSTLRDKLTWGSGLRNTSPRSNCRKS